MSLALATAALQTAEVLSNALRLGAQAGSKLRTPPAPDGGNEPEPQPRPPTAPPLPSDFRLTPVMVGLLQPALAAGGFKILDQERRAFTKVIVHSLAQNRGKQFSMLAVPHLIATDPGDTVLTFASLEYFFDDGSFVCLLSENVNLPHKSMREVIERRWPGKPGRSLRVKWLPWCDLEELPKAVTDADRLEALKDLVDISAQPPAKEMELEMSPQDKVALTRVLAGMDDFSTATTRKTSLGLAGLAQFSDLPGETARQACGALVLRLERAEGKPHPLRLLINFMLSCDLDADNKKVVTDLVDRYQFLG